MAPPHSHRDTATVTYNSESSQGVCKRGSGLRPPCDLYGGAYGCALSDPFYAFPSFNEAEGPWRGGAVRACVPTVPESLRVNLISHESRSRSVPPPRRCGARKADRRSRRFAIGSQFRFRPGLRGRGPSPIA